MPRSEVMNEIDAAAARIGIEPAALAAIASIESALRAFTIVEGRPEPLIRFEGHYFDRRLTGARRERARLAGLASPSAGKIANPASQRARWEMLNRASAIDRNAAFESVSWGLGQVMGAHWEWLGYGSVEAMVADARQSTAGQLRLMTLYIQKAGLIDALRPRDWAGFARGYNGPAYRANRYDTKLAAAYASFASTSRAQIGMLRQGARGEDIIALQRALSQRGYLLTADGIFGPATDAAVRRFQVDHGLAVDGVVGPATRKALDALSPSKGLSEWLWGFLRRLASN